jgi:competence protein ComEA
MDCGARRCLWGWELPTRLALSGLAMLLALGLGIQASRERRMPEFDSALVLDANSAPPEVLLALPRLGPALVGRIVAQRGQRRFSSLDDLDRRVRGIGPATAASIRPFLRFPPEGPPASPSLASRARSDAP